MDLDLTDAELTEIVRLISEGCTSGILDRADVRISWSLQYEKFGRR